MRNKLTIFNTIVIALGLLLLLLTRFYVQDIYYNRSIILVYLFFILVFTFRNRLTWVLALGGLVYLLLHALFGGVNDSHPTNWTNFLQPIYFDFPQTRVVFSLAEYVLAFLGIVLLLQRKSRNVYGITSKVF